MSDVPTTSIWADIGSFLLGTVEDVCDVSIVGPDPIALTPLPAALGGTSDDATALVATAVAPDAFLELLRAKAQYLLLPDHLIGQLRDASVVVMFAGVGMTGAPVTTSAAVQLGAEMPAYLAALGGDLGRQQSTTDPGPLGALYGELCRVWLQLVAAGDPAWQQLRADGINQFQGAATAQGPASADAAWVAAAVGYVSVRVTEWLRLLTQLSNAQLAAGSTPPAQLAQQVDDACDRYDKAFEATVFGRVENSPLLQPPLPEDLRAALEESLLGLKALTCHFANTALLGVPASIKESAVGVLNPQVKRLIAATAFAESFLNAPIAQGVMKQEQQIIWIYYHRVRDYGVDTRMGLLSSSAYKFQKKTTGPLIQPRYWLGLYLMGDRRYAGRRLPNNEEFKGLTVQQHVQTLFVQDHVRHRAESLLEMMDQIAAGDLTDPYPDWIGQGNLDDFNNVSDGNLKWTWARAYWWLQEKAKKENKEIPIWVKRLPPNNIFVQFIFHEIAIEKYFKTHSMEEPVKKYVP